MGRTAAYDRLHDRQSQGDAGAERYGGLGSQVMGDTGSRRGYLAEESCQGPAFYSQ